MRKFCAFIAFISLSLFTYSQTIDSALSKYASGYQPEKVYLHYDKSAYYPGETVWFKAYLMEGLIPAQQSRTLYVDWIAENGIVLSHTVSPIVDASTNGQFEVPADFKGDFIHVRAYTRWMMNFDTAFLYSKDIRILLKDSVKTKTAIAIKPVLEFFPEGGDIISGVPNKIAFKARDQFGRPVAIKAKLLNDKGTVLETFGSVHDGMGSFVFTPAEGINYSVKWTDEKNIGHTSVLPQIKSGGISMQLTVDGTKRIINLHSGSLSDNLKQLHLVGTIAQTMAFKNDLSIEANGSARRIIPTEMLPSGILTITLFDANWNAVAERITFVNNQEYSFQPIMEVQHWGLGKRKRNEIEIKLPDSLEGAELSISVTDASIEKDTSDHIISQFLLSGDIRGKVYNPAYYFSNNSDSVAQHLDLVMMTHGWRRFNWEELSKGKLPKISYPKDTAYLSLSGKLFGVAKNQLTGSESIVLLVKEKDTATKMLIMPIDREGNFSDPGVILFDTIKLYYSLKSKFLKQAEARFMTDRLPAPNYISFSKSFVNANRFYDTTGTYHHTRLASKALEVLMIQRGKTMAPVIITTTKKSPVQIMEEKYASSLFQGGDGYQFDLVNDPSSAASLDILTYLQGKVAGLQIDPTAQPPVLSWRGNAPQIFLDELPVEADMILNVPVSDIAFVKVIRPPFVGAFGGGAGGAIAVYTRKGDERKPGSGGLSSNTVAGYTPIREFYSPNYDRLDPRNDNLDIRTTLYWDPLLASKRKGNSIKLSFYNNDVTKSFRVVIEGMTKGGLLTHYETIME